MHPRPAPESPPDDPAPRPPDPPQEGECCESGCEDCVWTRYGAARQVYEAAFAAWLDRAEQRLAGE